MRMFSVSIAFAAIMATFAFTTNPLLAASPLDGWKNTEIVYLTPVEIERGSMVSPDA